MIKVGKIREQVKSGSLTPQQVLEWLKEQSFKSAKLERWLKNRLNKKTGNTPEVPEAKVEKLKKAKKRIKGKKKEEQCSR